MFHFSQPFLQILFISLFLLCIGRDQSHHDAHCIGQLALFHSIHKLSAVFVGAFNSVIQGVTGNILFPRNLRYILYIQTMSAFPCGNFQKTVPGYEFLRRRCLWILLPYFNKSLDCRIPHT